MRNKIVSGFIVGTFVTLYLMVSLISTIHVIEFFRLSNPEWLAVSLAIAFEVGAAASLASIIALKKMNQTLVWMLFIILTLMQAMGNTYYAFTHLENFGGWVELFDLVDEEVIYQKRILSILSGAILPVVALGFIKSLVDYIKPDNADIDEEVIEETETSEPPVESGDNYSKEEDPVEDKYNEAEEISVEPGEGITVDAGDSKPEEMDTPTIISPEHHSGMPNANSNKGPVADYLKRYPENLE